jgi:hypothetical protein
MRACEAAPGLCGKPGPLIYLEGDIFSLAPADNSIYSLRLVKTPSSLSAYLPIFSLFQLFARKERVSAATCKFLGSNGAVVVKQVHITRKI